MDRFICEVFSTIFDLINNINLCKHSETSLDYFIFNIFAFFSFFLNLQINNLVEIIQYIFIREGLQSMLSLRIEILPRTSDEMFFCLTCV